MTKMPPLIALAFTENKHTKSGWAGFMGYAKQNGYEIISLDLSKPLPEHRPDVIIHKLGSVLDQAEDGDEVAIKELRKFEDFVQTGKIPIIDPLDAVRRLLRREGTMNLLQGLIDGQDEPLFHIAPFAILSRADTCSKSNDLVGFPAVIKHLTAASSVAAHQMAIVPSPDQLVTALNDLAGPEDDPSNDKWFFQKWVNHDGVIFKVFVAGNLVHTVVRPSLHNVTPDQGIYHFDSQTIPKAFTNDNTTSPTGRKTPTFATDLTASEREAKEVQLDKARVEGIAKLLSEELQLTLFGFDVIVESGTNKHYVIDINYCPGYDGVPNFHGQLLEVVKRKLDGETRK